ncbi:Restriction endonuclease [Desulfotomaculum arcticum]|uniref:Restriction endonuclease n=1 Tax=Desulfotruncus arcticus DSM 17038 TaxID=1121424 RepID=A0A1I2NEE1_9FIRM|nr:restriction endonuclease [Desulfotruncus arcticus]SFG01209.1 Restriction endonuclease [Desulfotomaculum arcticum] [Desulfotruncus arcticus DSM 17038]
MFGDKLVNYLQDPPTDGRSRLASAADFVITNLLVWFITISAIYLLHLEKTIPTAAVSFFLLLETLSIIYIKKHKIKKLQTHKNIWYSAKQCRKNLKNIMLKKDFINFSKELLEASAPFEILRIVSDNNESSVDLSGYINGSTVGIMCLNPEDDNHKINSGQIKVFLKDINRSGYHKGIIITTGYYTDEARRLVRQMKGRVKIHLLDHFAVLRMAKKTGHPIFPDAAWQDETENKLTGMEMAISIKENILASRKRSLLFSILGIALLVIAMLNHGLVGLIYLGFGIVNLFIGLTGIILSFLRQEEHIFS